MSKNKGLGRGLSALIPKDKTNKATIENIKLDEINPNQNQPRLDFDKGKIKELAESIEKNGLIQPIILRKAEKGYEIVAGERRFLAVKSLKKESIPAIVRDIEVEESAKLALIENIQREDLNPVEEGIAFKEIINRYNLTQQELAKEIGKSRSYISNSMRLLDLKEETLKELRNGEISIGHGKAILSLKDKSLELSLLEKVLNRNLSVRETEKLVKSLNEGKEKKEEVDKKEEIYDEDNYLKTIESELMMSLGTKVSLKEGKNKGIIEIEFYSEEDLNRLIEMLK